MWKSKLIENGQSATWFVGNLRCSVNKNEDELQVESDYEDEREMMEFRFNFEVEFKEPLRCNCGVRQQQIQALPALPDRGVVARPQHAFQVAPHSEVRFFVGIPLNLRLYLGRDRSVMLVDLPGRLLSDTWFGDTFNGELCYNLRTRAVRNDTSYTLSSARAITEVKVRNEDNQAYILQRIHIPAPHLSIYTLANGQLWTESLEYCFAGENTPLKIRRSKGAPEHPAGLALLQDPRQPLQNNLVQRTFGTLRMFNFWT